MVKSWTNEGAGFATCLWRENAADLRPRRPGVIGARSIGSQLSPPLTRDVPRQQTQQPLPRIGLGWAELWPFGCASRSLALNGTNSNGTSGRIDAGEFHDVFSL
jgi:hypothetical protein